MILLKDSPKPFWKIESVNKLFSCLLLKILKATWIYTVFTGLEDEMPNNCFKKYNILANIVSKVTTHKLNISNYPI